MSSEFERYFFLSIALTMGGLSVAPSDQTTGGRASMFPAPIVAWRPMRRTRPNQQSEQAKPEQQPAAPSAQSLGDEKWWEVFQDPELQSLIRTALKNNYDVRIAATRVLQAQAQLGITRADQFPSLSAGGNITGLQSPKIGPIPAYEVTQGELTRVRSLESGFLGKVSPCNRIGTSQSAGQRMGPERSHGDAGRERGR